MEPMKIYRHLLILAAMVVYLILFSSPAQAQTGISFESFETENDFPRSLTFKTVVTSDADIVNATLVFHLRNEFSSNSITRIDLDFEPGRRVELSHTWDTGAGTIPGAAIIHYWEVTDADGHQLRSHEMTVRYEDTRFDWQVRENEAIAVWWHDRRESFGENVFEIAQQAVADQRQRFQADLDFQMRIMIYNNFDEFAEWNGVTSEFIGGQAFPNQGITAQIVSAYGSQEQWLNDVVPHEISHLYFAQVTFHRRSEPPTWLNEGLAQFNEFGSQDRALQTAVNAAESGDLISLSLLETGFGYFNESRTRLAYAEAVSAVTYLVETYGDDGLAALLAAYREGQTTKEAFPSALGVALGDFEAGWAGWLGLDAAAYATPTRWALPTFRPSPTPFVPGASSTGTPTSPANGTAVSPTTTITPKTAVPGGTAVAQTNPANTPRPPSPTAQPDLPAIPAAFLTVLSAILVLGCCVAILILGGVLWGLSRRSS